VNVGDSYAELAALSPLELQCVADRARDKRTAARSAEIRAAQTRPGQFPLSFGQEALWLLDRMTPLGGAYNEQISVLFEGELEVTLVERAINAVTRRHEILRTRFGGREPIQIVDEWQPVRLIVRDVTAGDRDERDIVSRDCARAESMKAFDITAGPLWRGMVLKRDAREHLLIVTMHHLTCDAWTLSLLIREVGLFYAAYRCGATPVLPPAVLQYGDFAVWQRQSLTPQRLAALLTYWRRQLDDAPGLELPTDRRRPTEPTFRGRRQTFRLAGSLSAALTALSRREGVTLYMTLLATFVAALARWTGQTDVVVGSPVAGRTRQQTESALGFFVNLLALRCDVSGDPTFRDLLMHVRQTALAAWAHQDLPFELLVTALKRPREPGRAPIFQVMFVLQADPAPAVAWPDVAIRPIYFDRPTTKFDLSLYMLDGRDGLTGAIEYSSDLFEAETIARLVRSIETLLAHFSAAPSSRLSDVPLLSDAERDEVLLAWNSPASD
jgi:hypothetical protein